jgi:hypothetical protein
MDLSSCPSRYRSVADIFTESPRSRWTSAEVVTEPEVCRQTASPPAATTRWLVADHRSTPRPSDARPEVTVPQRSRWVSAEDLHDRSTATRSERGSNPPKAVTKVLQGGDGSKSDPFTILFVANPALEMPWNSGVFGIDPVISNQSAFDVCVQYALDCLLGDLPGQLERFLANPSIGPRLRVLSIFEPGLVAADQNALVAQDGVSNLLVARRQVFVPYVTARGYQADVVFAISGSPSHDRASAWFTSDNDAGPGPGLDFTMDGVTASHRFYNLIPGTVAMHTSTRALTPLHEFSHAVSSYTNWAVVDLYVDSQAALNNKRGRPIPEQFANYSSVLTRSDRDPSVALSATAC